MPSVWPRSPAPVVSFVTVAAAAVAVTALAASVSACSSRKLSDRDCGEMLDRYVDMTIAQDPSLRGLEGPSLEAARAMKKALKKGEKRYRKVLEQCTAEVRRGEYDCAMAAPTPNDWEACID